MGVVGVGVVAAAVVGEVGEEEGAEEGQTMRARGKI